MIKIMEKINVPKNFLIIYLSRMVTGMYEENFTNRITEKLRLHLIEYLVQN